MNQYLEVLAFSNDLIVYFGEKIDAPTEDFVCPSEALSKRFNRAIGSAIWHLFQLGKGHILFMAREMKGMMAEDNVTQVFSQHALQAAVEYFPNGYGVCEFFAYCAAVAGAAALLYLTGDMVKDEAIFEVAAGVIGTVLGGHQVLSVFECSDKTWEEMTEVAEKFNACHGLES